jgi:hypothetical protein
MTCRAQESEGYFLFCQLEALQLWFAQFYGRVQLHGRKIAYGQGWIQRWVHSWMKKRKTKRERRKKRNDEVYEQILLSHIW